MCQIDGTIPSLQQSKADRRTAVPLVLPAAPNNLSQSQVKRRHIISAIVHSENSYVSSLQRLVTVSLINHHWCLTDTKILLLKCVLGLQKSLGREQSLDPEQLKDGDPFSSCSRYPSSSHSFSNCFVRLHTKLGP